MNLYIDESGSITKYFDNPNNRYFVIAILETDDPYHVIRQWKRAKKKYLKDNPKCSLSIKDEIKGSEMPYKMKEKIFDTIRTKTDAKFHFMIVDNKNLRESLLEQPSLSFNYFISLMLKRLSISKSSDDLFMLIDERNQAVNSLNSLEEYIKVKHTIETNDFKTVKLKYKDSSGKDLIQLADIFANTIYRISRTHANNGYDNKNRKLFKKCNCGIIEYFPYKYNDLDICK